MQNLYDPCYKMPKARISFPFQHQQSSDGNLQRFTQRKRLSMSHTVLMVY